jgi:hypothetical protein
MRHPGGLVAQQEGVVAVILQVCAKQEDESLLPSPIAVAGTGSWGCVAHHSGDANSTNGINDEPNPFDSIADAFAITCESYSAATGQWRGHQTESLLLLRHESCIPCEIVSKSDGKKSAFSAKTLPGWILTDSDGILGESA